MRERSRFASGAVDSLRRRLARGRQLGVQAVLHCPRRRGADIEMLEQVFGNLKTPFCLVIFNVDDLKSRFVFGGVGRKISEMSDAIYSHSQLMRKSLERIGLGQQKIDLVREIARALTVCMQNILKAAPRERRRRFRAYRQDIARLDVIGGDIGGNIGRHGTSTCTKGIDPRPAINKISGVQRRRNMNGDVPAFWSKSRTIAPIDVFPFRLAVCDLTVANERKLFPVLVEMDRAMRTFHRPSTSLRNRKASSIEFAELLSQTLSARDPAI
jgi:hypothetical protein